MTLSVASEELDSKIDQNYSKLTMTETLS